MLLFLRETWELFWWAMFCPSRLQQRMNEWCPQQEIVYKFKKDTSFLYILLFGNFRFIGQYLFLLLIFNISLLFIVIPNNQLSNWLQFASGILIAYIVGCLFLPLGLVIPFFYWILKFYQTDSWLSLKTVIEFLPPVAQLGIVLGVAELFLSLTVWLISIRLNKENFYIRSMQFLLTTIYLTLIVTLLATLVGWLATQNWFFLLLLTGITGFFLLLSREMIRNSDDRGRVALIITGGVIGGVTLIIARGVTGGVAGGIAGGVALFVSGSWGYITSNGNDKTASISRMLLTVGFMVLIALILVLITVGIADGLVTLTLSHFVVYTALISFAIAPAKNNLVFIITTVILITLSAENLGWLSALVIPVTLVSYYRIIDYVLFANISFFTSFLNSLFPPRLKIIYSLPPYTSELIWLPLPNHDQFIISEFAENPQQGLKIFQHIQTFSLPGFQITLQKALPQIVADQLKQIKSISELLFTANSNHPILFLLISPFYHLDEDNDTPTLETPLPKVKPELSILLPRLQNIVRDIQSALENKNIALRERGLERISNNLALLKLQLPALGLKNEAIKRWTPVLERWQRVIELEQSEQLKLSQGELINPFQYGNPVRLNQKDLFKGRQKFADEVVRRVLNLDRPTIVLHGPRRCGKTSFLYNLPRLLPSDILPVFVDMQSAAITNKESDFCYGLVRAIHKDCKSQGVKLPTLPQREQFQNSPYTNLEDWLDAALEQIGEKRILLNLDEFEKIGTAIQEGKLSLHLFDQLRHLIQHYEQLCFLFSGVQTLEELGPNWSSYFISVVPIEMVYLEPHEAEELLLNPDPAFKLRYDTGIVEELLKLTNCHPYCLQLLGASMVNQANFNRTDLITSELLQAAINEAFTSGQPYFTNMWREFTGTNPEEIAIGQELLLQVAKTDNLISINTPIAQKVVTRLVRYHILQEINGRYDFEVPLLKQWVRKRAVKI